MWSSAQITNYQPDELVGSGKNIAGFASELLILGAKDADGKIIALTPWSAVAVGQPIF
jgi:tRNA-binding protein